MSGNILFSHLPLATTCHHLPVSIYTRVVHIIDHMHLPLKQDTVLFTPFLLHQKQVTASHDGRYKTTYHIYGRRMVPDPSICHLEYTSLLSRVGNVSDSED